MTRRERTNCSTEKRSMGRASKMARNERDSNTTYATTANNANEFATCILSAGSSPWNKLIAKERYEKERHISYLLENKNVHYMLYTHTKFYNITNYVSSLSLKYKKLKNNIILYYIVLYII